MNSKGNKISILKKCSNSSARWLKRRFKDQYISKAKDNAYRSRSAFKLLQIDEKFKILSKATVVLDIGASPGGWLQVIKEKAKNAKVIGIDLKPISPIPEVVIIQSDIYDEALVEKLASLLPEKADLILSDMAADTSGDRQLDHIRNIGLVEAAFEVAKNNLKSGGTFVAKILQGGEEVKLANDLRKYFKTIKRFKPDASYQDSSEIYFLCLGYAFKN